MAHLAIKGHATRGNEVIEILEMLGGNNTTYDLDGSDENAYYYIHHDYIDADHKDMIGEPHPEFKHYTLEEFLEKFPYKVGDKVIFTKYGDNDVVTVESMSWTGTTIEYNYNGGVSCLAKDLQPYKEEIMEEIIKIDIPKGYEFDGIDNDNQQVVFTKIQPEDEYPKTYEKCCEISEVQYEEVSFEPSDYMTVYERDLERLLLRFRELIICRNAYWKIAGEQMGLDKPWEPDTCQIVYSIGRDSNRISFCNDMFGGYFILEFPTEEVRDAFYENFKDLIEKCTELL